MLEKLDSFLEEHKLSGMRGRIIALIGIICSCFFLYTSYAGSLRAINQRATLLVLVLPMLFLLKQTSPKRPKLSLVIDSILAIASVVVFVYVMVVYDELVWRVGNPNLTDMIMGTLAIILVIEATRRKVGWTLPILIFALILYGVAGPYMPDIFMHAGMNLKSFVSTIYLGEEGIFGTPCQVAADFIMIFVLFGAFLQASGAGDFFIKAADAACGWMRGGPAKAAVVSSGLMGSISGSAVANVVTTGTFTIPLMKRTGYKPEVAGAIEAVASTGGQIMPPLMGAAAFIMADFLEVPYWNVVVAAFIPAVLYYVALFFMVDLEAAKGGLMGRPKAELPSFKATMLEGGHLLIPVFALIYMLGVLSLSPQKSAFITIVLVILIGFIRSHTRINLRKFIGALISGAVSGLEVAIVCACAGIAIGILMRTGLGMALTGILIEVSHGILPILMLLTMVTSIIMGMGLPTSACYIIVAVLIAPAMVKMGVAPMAAHLFAFYYACLSTITPPVALAAFAGAGIAGSEPMRTGVLATKLGACGFIIPFMFVYGQSLLWVGSGLEILQTIFTATLGAFALAVGLQGYLFSKLSVPLRVLALVAALTLIKPGLTTDLIGLGIIIIVALLNKYLMKRQDEAATAA
ncbi:MAG: TRAP transporter permease [Syntrophomonadaceae bacterium]|jgi:TRAP transporter 4TM/12TM fusion protein